MNESRHVEFTCISTGYFETVCDRAASYISYGRPLKRSVNLSSHLSRAFGVMCEALGPSTSSSVLLHHTADRRVLQFIFRSDCAI